jgi:NADPH:quinone reductase-like Zn-dependent oxidoreductase
MKTLSYGRFGAVDVLHVVDADPPALKPGHVIVAVRASSLNVIDSRIRKGMMGPPLVNRRFPKVPGADLAGVVTAVAADVAGFAVGDTVFGAANPFTGGAMAEAVAVPAKYLAPKPPTLSFEDAAALPIAGIAALMALRDLGRIKAGDEVLIHGASGAVGLYAIQIARSLGARITAVTGTGGVSAIQAFGADEVIDYRKEDGQTFTRRFDLILNASGAMPYAKGKRFLKPRGELVEPSPTVPVFIGSKIANLFRSRKHLMLQTVPNRKDLDVLVGMIAAGGLRTTIAKTYDFSDAKAAFTRMEKGGVVGKLIVRVG